MSVLRLPVRPHDARIPRGALRLRWWSPRMVWLVGRALLRFLLIWPELCETCGGQGRLVKRQFLRRTVCPTCRGTRVQKGR